MTRWTGEANASSWLVSLDLHWYKNIVMVVVVVSLDLRWYKNIVMVVVVVSLDLHWYKNIVMVSLTLTINQFDPGVSLGDKFSAFRNCNAELEGGSDFRRWPE